MKGPALLSLPGRIAEIRQEETVLVIEVFSEQTRGQCPVCLRGVRLSQEPIHTATQGYSPAPLCNGR